MDPRESIASFLETELGRTEDRAIIKMVLHYVPIGDFGTDTMRTWHKSDPRDADAFDAQNSVYRAALANTIAELAEQRATAEGGSGRRHFRLVLSPVRGDRITHAFAILPAYSGQEGELLRDDLQPSHAGVLSQVMAQNHDLHRAIGKRMQHEERLIAGIATLINSLTKNQGDRDERMWKRISELEESRAKSIHILEEAKTLEHERMLDAKVVEASEERKSKAIETLTDIGKAIAGSFGTTTAAGAKAGKPTNGTSTLADQLKAFLASLSKDQQSDLLAGLPMEQKIALGEMAKFANAPGLEGEEKLYDFLTYFFAKLDEPSVELIEETLTGKQKHAFDAIYERVAARANRADGKQPTPPIVDVPSGS